MRASTPHGRRRNNNQVELQHPGHGEEEGGIGGSMADTGGRPEVSLATVRSPGHPAASTTAAAAADLGHADTGQEVRARSIPVSISILFLVVLPPVAARVYSYVYLCASESRGHVRQPAVHRDRFVG